MNRPAAAEAFVEVGSAGALHPQDADVLFGRGRAHVRHPGNKALHALTNHYTSIYKEFSRSSLGAVKRKKQYGVASKQEIVDTIIDQIQQRGGRFLRRQEDDRNLWRQVDNNEARAKVSRILRGKERRRYNRPIDDSSIPKRCTGVPDDVDLEAVVAVDPQDPRRKDSEHERQTWMASDGPAGMPPIPTWKEDSTEQGSSRPLDLCGTHQPLSSLPNVPIPLVSAPTSFSPLLVLLASLQRNQG